MKFPLKSINQSIDQSFNRLNQSIDSIDSINLFNQSI